MNIFRRPLQFTYRVLYHHSDKVEKQALKKPVNPTIYGSFGSNLKNEQLERIMDPKGFLDFDEQKRLLKEETASKRLKEELEKINIQMKETKSKAELPYKLDKNGFAPEGGYRYLGLEPTRYGDWDIKGRLSDF